MIEVAFEIEAELRDTLLKHVAAELPNEACALLIGQEDRLIDVILTGNIDCSPTSYTVDPAEVLAAHDMAEAKGLEVIGVAHSHPNGPAAPSPRDVAGALDRTWIYVIVGSEGEIKSWKVSEGLI